VGSRVGGSAVAWHDLTARRMQGSPRRDDESLEGLAGEAGVAESAVSAAAPFAFAGTLEIHATEDAMLCDPPGLLMSQIRDSDFLAQNPATGPSLFELAQQQGDGEEHALEICNALEASMLAAGADAKGSATGRDESVEDLATLLVRQVSAVARARPGLLHGHGRAA
jgi:hypothetical protein